MASPERVNSNSGDRVNVDHPPFSRAFVVCSKNNTEEEIRACFAPYGFIEDIWMVKDRMTKENKGICYVKYDKASSAALAIENLDGKVLGADQKPIKVMIASAKNAVVKTDYSEESTRTRLFVVVPKHYTEDDLRAKFEPHGDFEYCNIVRDRSTGENKGFGYVKFSKASTAAVAMENCDKSFKAILAEPKSAKFAREAAYQAARERRSLQDNYAMMSGNSSPTHSTMDLLQSYAASDGGVSTRLFVTVAPSVTQEQLIRLFDLVPGMDYCDLKHHHVTGDSRGFAFVTYSSIASAMYAKEKLNGFEYPPGFKVLVKYAEDPPGTKYGPGSPTELAAHFHSAPHSPVRSPVRSLSPVRPMVTRQRRHSISSELDTRVFFICHPNPPAEHVLRDVFGRFGILTDVWVVRGKNYGYAKFTNRASAEAAITALHGMEVFGVKLRVMLADPPPQDQSRKRQRT